MLWIDEQPVTNARFSRFVAATAGWYDLALTGPNDGVCYHGTYAVVRVNAGDTASPLATNGGCLSSLPSPALSAYIAIPGTYEYQGPAFPVSVAVTQR